MYATIPFARNRAIACKELCIVLIPLVNKFNQGVACANTTRQRIARYDRRSSKDHNTRTKRINVKNTMGRGGEFYA